MTDKKTILTIVGSTRGNSSNKAILNMLQKAYKDELHFVRYDTIDTLPHFNPDLDTEEHLPDTVKAFRNVIADADGVIICTPEYVFSLPGSLKNAIEWNVSTTLFSNKPMALIVAAASGTKAFESLQLIMETLEANIPSEAKVLIQGIKGKINAQGEVMDKKTIQQLHSVMKSLIQFL